MNIFFEKVQERISNRGAALCIGIDPELAIEPEISLRKALTVIDATKDVVSCYKPNTAFFEAHGAPGVECLKKLCDYIHTQYTDIPVIVDAKRGDIEPTNKAYAQFVFEYLSGDAVTLQPYLGSEPLSPFLEREAKACFILCKTSNPGAAEIQDLVVDSKPLFVKLATKVQSEWNKNSNCGLVAGATHIEELEKIREVAPDLWLLIPGVGAQGGSLEEVVKTAKQNFIINTSRSIWNAENPEVAAQKMNTGILSLV